MKHKNDWFCNKCNRKHLANDAINIIFPDGHMLIPACCGCCASEPIGKHTNDAYSEYMRTKKKG